jgi:putative transposase
MELDRRKHRRQSHRLRGYDYSLSAPYFVTLCPQNYLCLFGQVTDEQMVLNQQGKMVETWLNELENKFSGVLLDCFQVMPNHLHAIIVIMQDGLDMAARFGIGTDNLDFETADQNNGTPQQIKQGGHIGPPLHPSLGRVVQWFKTMTTNDYMRGVHTRQWKPFKQRLWQRDYFDHIIRNERTLTRVRDYIRDNPVYWMIEKQGARTFDDPSAWLLD